MANPDHVNVSDAELREPRGYSVMADTTEPVQPRPGPSYHPHVRHPFPFSAIAGQLSGTGFPASANVDYHPPAVTAPAPTYDGRFNHATPFSQQYPCEVMIDRNGPPLGSSYQTNVDAVRPVGTQFDNFSSLFHVMTPASAGSPQLYTSSQSRSYPSPPSGFTTQAHDAGFASPLQSSSSRPWPPPPDLHRPQFAPLSRFPLVSNESSVGELCAAFPAVGSDSLSSGSPITELLDHATSPTHLPGATYSRAATLPSPSISDVLDSVRGTVVTSPYRASPIDSLQLSRSLPAGVRFGSSAAATDAAVGHHPASRMQFDSTLSASPMSHHSLFQSAGLLDDRASPGYQVYSYS